MDKHQYDYEEYSELINEYFVSMFDKTYKSTNKNQRAKLLPCLANLYRRWYYSSIIENTYLTPANLFESLNRQCGKDTTQTPTIHMKTPVKYTGVDFMYQKYSYEDHPIIADLHTLIDFCQPDILLTEANEMLEEQAYEVSKKLHIKDPCYATYLLSIALHMGLFVKIPSIHANRAQTVKDIEKRMAIPNKDMFDKIVSSSLHYAAYNLAELIPLPVSIFDEEYLVSILKEPVEADVIFQRMHDTLGVDLEDFVGFDLFEELDMLDMAVISGTYLLGVVLDKFFLTPFGHYLKLIRPVYMISFDFINEVDMYLDSYSEEDEIGIAFYAPYSRYYLTDMGLSYFGVKPNPANYLDIKNKLGFNKAALLFDPHASAGDLAEIVRVFDREECIYTLKVKYLADPKMWLHIDVSDITTLHKLYLELAYYFDLEKNGEYAFYPNEEENPFLAYASPNQLRRAKQATDTILGELELDKGEKFVLSVSYPKIGMGTSKHKEKWTLEVMKTHKGKPGMTYPAVIRLGKGLQDFFEWG